MKHCKIFMDGSRFALEDSISKYARDNNLEIDSVSLSVCVHGYTTYYYAAVVFTEKV